MQWAAALHGQVKMLDLKKDGHLCGSHPSWDHSSSNATWPSGGMATGKGRKNCLLKAVGNAEDTGQVPLFLASQLLTVFLRSKGRCHPPHMNNVLLFLPFWHPFISSLFHICRHKHLQHWNFQPFIKSWNWSNQSFWKTSGRWGGFIWSSVFMDVLILVLAFFASLFTRLMDVWEEDVSKACVVCSWETFELVAEKKVGHKTARGSHSSWPWKRDSESSQPTEGSITLEATKVKGKLLHLNDCLGTWCKWQKTK